jgi:hypothetical protein
MAPLLPPASAARSALQLRSTFVLTGCAPLSRWQVELFGAQVERAWAGKEWGSPHLPPPPGGYVTRPAAAARVRGSTSFADHFAGRMASATKSDCAVQRHATRHQSAPFLRSALNRGKAVEQLLSVASGPGTKIIRWIAP